MVRSVVVFALGSILSLACQARTPVIDDVAEPVTAQFSVSVDPTHAALQSKWQQPVAAPATASGGLPTLALQAFVHKEAQAPTRLWVELFFVSTRALGLRDVTLTVHDVAGAGNVYDFTHDPYAAPQSNPHVRLGAIAPEGVGRVTLGFDTDGKSPLSFGVALAGTTTRFTAASSAPLALTSDGRELWAVVPDAAAVAVVDTAAAKRVASVAVGRQPRSIALTPEDDQALVVSADANQLAVVDRNSRRVVQTLGEGDGIGRDPRHVVIAPDGTRAWVSAFVGDRITALARHGDRWAVTGKLDIGRRPTGLSITPDGATLYVAHFLPRGPVTDNEAWVSVVDTATLTESRQAIWRDDGNPSEMTCVLGQFKLPPERAPELSFEAVPGALAGVFLTPGGDHGYVPATELAPIPIFEGDPSKAQIGAQLGANNPAFLLPLDAHDPAAAAPLLNPGGIDFIDDTNGFARCKRPRIELEFGTRLPMKDDPSEIYAPGVATPSFATPLSETGVVRFVGYTRGGRRALALSHAADELVVFDATTHAPTTQRYLPLSGSNPTGIVVSPDGTRGWVSYDNTLALSVLDLSAYADPAALPGPSYVPFRFDDIPGALPATVATRAFPVVSIATVPALPSAMEVGTIALADVDPMDPVLRRGRTLFDSSNPDKYPQLSAIREATCNACHPDGTADGSIWSTMEGERRTVSLAGGVAGRGWLHQSATHRNAFEFAQIIVKERLGGTGLSDEDADALARWVAFGIPRSQPPPVDAALAAAGKSVFEAHCTSCHQGPALTSGNPDPADPYGGGGSSEPMLVDVHDASDSAGAILGPAYTAMFPPVGAQLFAELRGDRALGDGDPVQQLLGFRARPTRARGQLKAPSLVGVWDRVLYFHDGHAADLDAAVRDIESRVGAAVTADEHTALVEYLKTL